MRSLWPSRMRPMRRLEDLLDHPLWRIGTAPGAVVYGLLTCLWHHAYDVGLRKTVRLPVPVVSVGSLFAGGSGKTPFVMYLARYFRTLGYTPLVLSRGYRGRRGGVVWVDLDRSSVPDWRDIGDEPAMLARWVPVTVAVGRRRETAYALAAQHGAFDVVLLDDGFQYRRLARTVDLVLIDVPNWQRYRRLLPSGRLREPLHHLRRADAVLLTKGRFPEEYEAVERDLQRFRSWRRPIFRVVFSVGPFLDMQKGGRPVPLEELRRGRWIVTATVADPDSFVQDLRAAGIDVAATWVRPDHAPWGPAEVRRLELASRTCWGVLTTLKDWVKMEACRPSVRVIVVGQRLSFGPSGLNFPDWLQHRLRAGPVRLEW
jgi:tetraacyldisaccharide 4'-kinase